MNPASAIRDQDPMAPGSAAQVGRDVLGPIFAEFAQRLWMLQHFLPGSENACLLFCARGGLRMRLIYERFLAQTGLQPRLPSGDLMVSRLVAARTPFVAPGPALFQELDREFQGHTMAEVAVALTQDHTMVFSPLWQQPFDAGTFVALLREKNPDAGCKAAHVRDTIARLDAAFRRHLASVTRGRSTVVLCDTGLYGSTGRLLGEGIPEINWVSALFARSNYKHFDAPHFATTVGLSVEHDGYVPWNTRTAVLRFWHLIESTLEPDLASVVTFTEETVPRSNLEVPGWQDRIGAEDVGLFYGVMAHIEGLGPADLAQISPRAKQAWHDLRQKIIWPQPADLRALTLSSPRARDFGRNHDVHQFPARAPIRESLWREGAFIDHYPRLGIAAQALLEAAQISRGLRRMAHKSLKPQV